MLQVGDDSGLGKMEAEGTILWLASHPWDMPERAEANNCSVSVLRETDGAAEQYLEGNRRTPSCAY